MTKPAILAFALFSVLIAEAQSVNTTPRKATMPRKVPGTERPACSPGAICFSGEVSAGEEFRKILNADLEFVLARGWQIAIVPRRPEGDGPPPGHCDEFASVVNGPYRAHRDLLIDVSYGWTAEQEVETSPREFRFVTNCTDFRIEWERLMIVLGSTPATPEQYEKTIAQLGSNAEGKGRLWITDSRVSHADDGPDDQTPEGLKLGKIKWIKFSVEIVLPRQ
jgi:hypothetical protein